MTQNNTAFYGLLAPDNRTQARTGNVQNDSYRGWAVDTYAAYRIGTALGVHELTAGLDVSDKGGRLVNGNCSLRPIDLYSPVYGAAVTCAAPSDSTQAIFGAGLYLRDQWHVGNGLHLTLGARHDRVTTKTTNNINGSTNAPKDAATTGMVGAVYEVFPGVAPYVSLANSFLPVSGLDRNANVFQPETGRQAEVGVKFERDGGRQTASVAAYDLLRANVLTADPLNAAFNVQQGEQRVKGVEIELLADLRSGWNLTAAYAYTDAVVTKSNVAAQLGRSVNNVPRHSASAFGMYRASSGAMAGWGAGLGVRKVGTRTGYSYDFAVPGYTVFDAAVSFKGNGYRASLNVRNLLDKTYYGGSFSNNLVTLGDTRQLRLNVVREF